VRRLGGGPVAGASVTNSANERAYRGDRDRERERLSITPSPTTPNKASPKVRPRAI